MTCSVIRDALVLAPLGSPGDLLAPKEATEFALHVVSCSDCRGRASAFAELCAAWTDGTPDLKPSADARQRLLGDLPAASSEPPPRVKLSAPPRSGQACTYCHGQLGPRATVVCATCLAPHHRGCFRAHGSCATFGCPETKTHIPPRAGLGGRSRRLVLRYALAAAAVLVSVLSGGIGYVRYQRDAAALERAHFEWGVSLSDTVSRMISPRLRSPLSNYDQGRWKRHLRTLVQDSGGGILAAALVEIDPGNPRRQTLLAQYPNQTVQIVVSGQRELESGPRITISEATVGSKPVLRIDRRVDGASVTISLFVDAQPLREKQGTLFSLTLLLTLMAMLSCLALAAALVFERRPPARPR